MASARTPCLLPTDPMRFPLSTACLVALLTAAPARALDHAPVHFFVRKGAPMGGDGLSWETAFRRPEQALVRATNGDEVWLTEGTWTPQRRTDPQDPRSVTFAVPSGVRLRGGFEGWEASADERLLGAAPTVLSGKLAGGQGSAYHVVTLGSATALQVAQGMAQASELDQLTVTGGRADTPGHQRGGGLLAEGGFLRMTDCVMEDNRAGMGGAAWLAGGTFRLRRCLLRWNDAADKGGALGIQAAVCHVGGSRLVGNSADRGGAIYVHSIATDALGGTPHVAFQSCVLSDNTARVGGAAFLQGSQSAGAGRAWFQSSTVAFNRATERSGGIHARVLTPMAAESHVHNSIVWFNEAPLDPELGGDHDLRASTVGDPSWTGSGVVSQDPRFVDGPARDLRLRWDSPCIDAGDNGLLPADLSDLDGDGFRGETLPRDVAGRRRIGGPSTQGILGSTPGVITDLGAHES